MAAIALTAATWTACSNDDEPTTAEQPAQSRTFTVTTTLSPRNGATTRSTMTDNGDGSISATWEVGDEIWVGYTQNGDTPEETMATVTAVDPTTKAAKITLTLTNPKDGGDITFGYPYSLYTGTKKLRTDQIGTLADINANFACIYGDVKMTVIFESLLVNDVIFYGIMITGIEVHHVNTVDACHFLGVGFHSERQLNDIAYLRRDIGQGLKKLLGIMPTVILLGNLRIAGV